MVWSITSELVQQKIASNFSAVLAVCSVLSQHILDASPIKGYCSSMGVWPYSLPSRRYIVAACIPRIPFSSQFRKFLAGPVSEYRRIKNRSTGWNSNEIGRAHCARPLITVAKLCSTPFLSLLIVKAQEGLKFAKCFSRPAFWGLVGCFKCIQKAEMKGRSSSSSLQRLRWIAYRHHWV